MYISTYMSYTIFVTRMNILVYATFGCCFGEYLARQNFITTERLFALVIKVDSIQNAYPNLWNVNF